MAMLLFFASLCADCMTRRSLWFMKPAEYGQEQVKRIYSKQRQRVRELVQTPGANLCSAGA